MSNDFFIKISEESEALCYNFGVFSSKVQTPNTFVCSKHAILKIFLCSKRSYYI